MAARLRKGGDTSGRLASTPTIARGSFDLAESGLGRYTDILHVDFYDAGRRKETSQEDYAELLVERAPA